MTRPLTLVLFERLTLVEYTYMPSMKSMSLIVEKLLPKLKVLPQKESWKDNRRLDDPNSISEAFKTLENHSADLSSI